MRASQRICLQMRYSFWEMSDEAALQHNQDEATHVTEG